MLSDWFYDMKSFLRTHLFEIEKSVIRSDEIQLSEKDQRALFCFQNSPIAFKSIQPKFLFHYSLLKMWYCEGLLFILKINYSIKTGRAEGNKIERVRRMALLSISALRSIFFQSGIVLFHRWNLHACDKKRNRKTVYRSEMVLRSLLLCGWKIINFHYAEIRKIYGSHDDSRSEDGRRRRWMTRTINLRWCGRRGNYAINYGSHHLAGWLADIESIRWFVFLFLRGINFNSKYFIKIIICLDYIFCILGAHEIVFKKTTDG